MKKFEIPEFYKSELIAAVKDKRKASDKLKNDFTPTEIPYGKVSFSLARHFGFCYGVENAIEIVYKTLLENPDKRIYLLSEMIHNPLVNQDLQDQGIQFIMDTGGETLIAWSEITKEDIVVIPAFGTTTETLETLEEIGVDTVQYNTTCPFVEKVWKRAAKLGKDEYTIIIHGKAKHEETRATFSHSKENAPALVVQNIEEAKVLAEFIKGKKPLNIFKEVFAGKYSKGFNPETDLKYLGVVNQTTMLATETQEIADYLKGIISEIYGEEYFADTRDTLCYATSDNQNAVYGMLEKKADFAIVVGGYNSSNTSHLVELCEEKLNTFHIASADEIKENGAIRSYKFRKDEFIKSNLLKEYSANPKVLITSGASCPDAVVEKVMDKVANLFNGENSGIEKLELIEKL